ncbi:MAG TPA: DNA polymerase I [Ottowia sp.]|uniref:DNA polymerase I n=1 Tax=Ottowia sp. TaxID=1898956 RepID=UPI002C8FB558|nr:DNA polymerase I [Ottowia sp.]HMN21541.1 DNA polymerase I [Ottowia sp.]
MSDASRADAPRLLLVDGSSYLYRAFHAMPDLRADPADRNSQPTGAIRGMVNMLNALRKEYPDAPYAVCVFDAPGPTFRDEIYPDYKASRAPMPDDLRSQIGPIHEVVGLLGWKVLAVPGIEADDVIGTLAQAAADQGLEVVISSGDKDLAQLVTDRIHIIDTMSGKRRDLAGVQAEFGVAAAQMLDYQTLVGDAIDNVPGVDKVGPKTAAKWLAEYGSLDAIVAHADAIKGAAGQNLRAALDWLPTGRKLLQIRTDCDLAGYVDGLPALDAVAVQPEQAGELAAFYERYGFRTLARALRAARATDAGDPAGEDAAGDGDAGAVRYEVIQDWRAFERWLARIEAAELTAFDTETTSIDQAEARIVGLSFSVEPLEAAYIPLAHDGPDAPHQLPLDEVLARLKPWFGNPACRKLGQHIKYDRHVLANHGVEVAGYVHDTMLQSYVLEVHRPHNLASLAERHLGRGGIQYEDLCGKGAHQIPFSQVPVEQAARYSCEDSDQTLAVHRVLWPKLQANERLRGIYELEIACSEVLYRIERHGVLLDTALLRRQSEELGQRIVALEHEAHELAGQPFNLGSPKQIGEIFFDKLGLPVVKKTATGRPSTDEEVLEKLAEDYPLPARILEHRGLSKLKGTYTDKLPQLVDAQGRVHTHFAQAVAVTGRLASNDPNLQNIPVRTPEGRRIREAFIAPPGHVVVSCDYSQIELRIMAHLSDDAALLKAFHDGMDVHRATASEVFGVAPDQVSSEQRRYAKVINFGLIYGMSSYGLARNLGIDGTAAKNYIQRYFERYPGVKRYMDETRELARKQGYVETVFGRRLYLPEINSPNGPRRAGAERAAINAPMQGTAADLIKKSMVAVQQAIDGQQRASRMILQVHDELVLEVPDGEVDWVQVELPRLMASVAALKVPLVAEVGVGPNWERAH